MNEEQGINWRDIKQTLKSQAIILGGFILFIWLVEIVDWLFFRGALNNFGIRPREIGGLEGILFAPLLHGSFAHLMANTLPLLVLGWFVLLRGTRTFITVTLVVVLVSGLGTWLIGPTGTTHIGASGLVFGYFGYLLLNSWFERSLSAVLWAVGVFFLYGGLMWGVLPQGNGISWQGHLFGFIGGGVAAYLLAKRADDDGHDLLDSDGILRIREDDLW